MKKGLAISLALIYLMVSSGILLEIHHCMGRIADTGLVFINSAENDQCGKCGMDKNNTGNKCCKDEYKQVKISSDQKPPSPVFSPDAPQLAELPVLWPQPSFHLVGITPKITNPSHAPPNQLPDRQSLLCVFRI